MSKFFNPLKEENCSIAAGSEIINIGEVLCDRARQRELLING